MAQAATVAQVSPVAAANSAESISERIATHVITCNYESIPADAVVAAKRAVLDTLAVAWGGSNAPGSEATHQLLVEEGGRKDSSVWAYGGKLPASSATFVNTYVARQPAPPEPTNEPDAPVADDATTVPEQVGA